MNIKTASKELNAKERYFLTMAPNIGKMKNAVGQRLEVDYWCIYEDTDRDGKPQTILSIKTDDGDVYATISATFIQEFIRMQEVFREAGETVKAIEVIASKSKAGRDFITCVFAE